MVAATGCPGFTPDIRSGTLGTIGFAIGGIRGGWETRGGPTKSPNNDWLLGCVVVNPDISGWVGRAGIGGIGGFMGAATGATGGCANWGFGAPVGLRDASRDGGKAFGTSMLCSFKLIILQAIENSRRSSLPSALVSARDHI